MKAIANSIIPVEPQFIPVELKLVFETQAELDTFYALFNSILIADFLKKELSTDPAGHIRKILNEFTTNDQCEIVYKFSAFLKGNR